MYRLANLLDARSLLARPGGHFVEQLFDVLGAAHHFVHGLARLAHGVYAGAHLVGAVLNQRLDFFGGLRAAARQGPHFRGHDRKAAPLFTGACGFYRCVQGQDVGLERNAVDHSNDVADFLR